MVEMPIKSIDQTFKFHFGNWINVLIKVSFTHDKTYSLCEKNSENVKVSF